MKVQKLIYKCTGWGWQRNGMASMHD